jgi:hypothetical protein
MTLITDTRRTRYTALAAAAVTAGLLATPAAAHAGTSSHAGKSVAEQTHSSTVTHLNRLTPKVQNLVKGSGVAAERKALTTYWTSARMKAAKPVEQSTAFQQRVRAQSQSLASSTGPQGPAGAIAPSKGTIAPKAATSPSTIQTQSWQPNLPYNHPAARTQGKVFFTRDGYNYVCSATVVNSEGKSLVWTAGHCVVEDGIWDSNFTFVPAYRNGSRPYGTWYARQLTTTSAWYNYGDFGQDNGAVTMNRRSGYRIAGLLGGQGLRWNQTVSYNANAFGYPAAYPYGGRYLNEVSGRTYADSDGSSYMYSGFTGGSSGGAWLRGFDGKWGYVNGHNDYHYLNTPAYMHSPYYGTQVASLFNAVRYQTS